MKTLIVFYSRTGTTKKLAEKIAEFLKADIEEIIDLKDRSGAVGWLASGRDAMKKKLTDIKKINNDISKFDLIIIGTPNWAGSVTPAIRTFLLKNKDNIKKIAFFCTMGGENPGKVFIQMQELINIRPLGILALNAKEVIKEMNVEKIKSFIKSLK
jgi:flavodoxin